jgi:8-oxo-dGTP diphosphatase
LEILEVGLFTDAELPTELAMGTGEMLAAARRGGEPVIE